MKRPMPPQGLLGEPDDPLTAACFAPAPDVLAWLLATFVEEDGPLHNEEHAHIASADLAVLWAVGGYEKAGRTVLGTMELVSFRSSGWAKWRQEDQLKAWFGRVPEFLMTLSAAYAATCSDVEWCALVEHELYHLGHKQGAFGPEFTKEGRPKFAIRGHDVEEFIGVVRRYGALGAVRDMVDAAKKAPQVPHFTAAHACGTCLERAA